MEGHDHTHFRGTAESTGKMRRGVKMSRWGGGRTVQERGGGECISVLQLPKQSTANWVAENDGSLLSVLRLNVQNEGVGRAALPPEALGKDPSLSLPASLPASGGSRQPTACRDITLIPASTATPFSRVSVSLSLKPGELGPTLRFPHHDLLLTNYIRNEKTLFPNKDTF